MVRIIVRIQRTKREGVGFFLLNLTSFLYFIQWSLFLLDRIGLSVCLSV